MAIEIRARQNAIQINKLSAFIPQIINTGLLTVGVI